MGPMEPMGPIGTHGNSNLLHTSTLQVSVLMGLNLNILGLSAAELQVQPDRQTERERETVERADRRSAMYINNHKYMHVTLCNTVIINQQWTPRSI